MSNQTSDAGAAHAEANDARGRILARVREAIAGRDSAPHPGPLSRGSSAEPKKTLDAFVSAFTRAGGEIVVLEGMTDALTWLGDFARGFASAAVSPDVPSALRPGLPTAQPHNAELGISLASAAGAATGSLLLSSRSGRALQLLPPTHLVWVEANAVHPDLGEALAEGRRQGPLPAVFAVHSGPSKSADIGRIVVTGVHGPGRVVAAVVPKIG